jgi:hypothetical protein
MAGSFQADGPWLPVEFSRVAQDGRVTLAIDPVAPAIQTYSVRLSVSTLEDAVSGLGTREKILPERWADWIGLQTRDLPECHSGETPPEVRETIAAWLAEKPLDAVVWTALPVRGPKGALGHPTLEVLLRHLSGLEGAALARAEEYIRRAPVATRTPRRACFEAELGWTAQVEN